MTTPGMPPGWVYYGPVAPADVCQPVGFPLACRRPSRKHTRVDVIELWMPDPWDTVLTLILRHVYSTAGAMEAIRRAGWTAESWLLASDTETMTFDVLHALGWDAPSRTWRPR